VLPERYSILLNIMRTLWKLNWGNLLLHSNYTFWVQCAHNHKKSALYSPKYGKIFRPSMKQIRVDPIIVWSANSKLGLIMFKSLCNKFWQCLPGFERKSVKNQCQLKLLRYCIWCHSDRNGMITNFQIGPFRRSWLCFHVLCSNNAIAVNQVQEPCSFSLLRVAVESS